MFRLLQGCLCRNRYVGNQSRVLSTGANRDGPSACLCLCSVAPVAHVLKVESNGIDSRLVGNGGEARKVDAMFSRDKVLTFQIAP
jgi:hypothetical protein